MVSSLSTRSFRLEILDYLSRRSVYLILRSAEPKLSYVEAICQGISRPLQHSSVWLLHVLISNGLGNTIATTFLYFSSWLITGIISATTSSLATFLLKVQPHDPSNRCQTVNYANVLSCAIHIRPKCDCAPTHSAYFPSRPPGLTKTFSTLILTDYY